MARYTSAERDSTGADAVSSWQFDPTPWADVTGAVFENSVVDAFDLVATDLAAVGNPWSDWIDIATEPLGEMFEAQIKLAHDRPYLLGMVASLREATGSPDSILRWADIVRVSRPPISWERDWRWVA